MAINLCFISYTDFFLSILLYNAIGEPLANH